MSDSGLVLLQQKLAEIISSFDSPSLPVQMDKFPPVESAASEDGKFLTLAKTAIRARFGETQILIEESAALKNLDTYCITEEGGPIPKGTELPIETSATPQRLGHYRVSILSDENEPLGDASHVLIIRHGEEGQPEKWNIDSSALSKSGAGRNFKRAGWQSRGMANAAEALLFNAIVYIHDGAQKIVQRMQMPTVHLTDAQMGIMQRQELQDSMPTSAVSSAPGETAPMFAPYNSMPQQQQQALPHAATSQLANIETQPVRGRDPVSRRLWQRYHEPAFRGG